MNDGNGTLDATVRGNTVANPAGFAVNGLLALIGTTGGTENTTSCLNLGDATTATLKNSLTGSGGSGATDIRVRQLASTTVKLPGYGGTATDNAAVVSYLQGRNNPATTPTASATNTGTGGGFVAGTCAVP